MIQALSSSLIQILRYPMMPPADLSPSHSPIYLLPMLLLKVTLLNLVICNLVSKEAQAQTPQHPAQATQVVDQKPLKSKTHQRDGLDSILSRIATRSVERLRPDVINGLIRVGVPTTRGTIVDRPSREALTALLTSKVSQQPNIFVADIHQTINMMRNFDGLSLPLSQERSISLGQHIGVRYMLLTQLSEGTEPQSFTLKAELVSIKRRGVIYEETFQISRTDYQRLRSIMVFDEHKLSATWRSGVIPGWGQLYQGKTGTAIAYFSLTAALVTGALWSQNLGQTAEDRYQENLPNTINYRFEANQHYTRARLMWGALGVTWLSSTLSAYLQGENQARVQLNLDPTQGGLNLSGKF